MRINELPFITLCRMWLPLLIRILVYLWTPLLLKAFERVHVVKCLSSHTAYADFEGLFRLWTEVILKPFESRWETCHSGVCIRCSCSICLLLGICKWG